jgi:uncharacterized membrane protein
MKKIILLIAILCSFICTIAQSPKKTYTDIQNKKIKVLFHGFGTEPFWDIYILENSVIFAIAGMEIYESLKMTGSFSKSKYSQVFTLKNAKGEKTSLQIIKKPGDDGMSEQVYPYTVKYNRNTGAGKIGY